MNEKSAIMMSMFLVVGLSAGGVVGVAHGSSTDSDCYGFSELIGECEDTETSMVNTVTQTVSDFNNFYSGVSQRHLSSVTSVFGEDVDAESQAESTQDIWNENEDSLVEYSQDNWTFADTDETVVLEIQFGEDTDVYRYLVADVDEDGKTQSANIVESVEQDTDYTVTVDGLLLKDIDDLMDETVTTVDEDGELERSWVNQQAGKYCGDVDSDFHERNVLCR